MAAEGLGDPDRAKEVLRDALKSLRDASGPSQPKLAVAVGVSQPAVSRWVSPNLERVTVPTWQQLDRFLSACAADPATAQSIRALRRDVEVARLPERERVLANSRALQQRIYEYEQSADRVETFMPMIVPGSVQTEDYMRAIFVGANVAEVEESIAPRLARRGLFDDGTDRRWRLVMSEAALQWRVGDSAVMAEQCEYLAEFNHPRVELGVITWDTHVGFVVNHGVELYVGDSVSRVVMGTLVGTAILTDDDPRYAQARGEFDRVVGAATFGARAREVFAGHARAYRRELGEH